jgi:uncharacterized protein YeaO (DUF488 family)
VQAPSQTANVRTKSVYDAPEPSDGRRVLVTRYWPRGVSKTAVDEYARALSPSADLLRAYKDGLLDWPRFRRQYVVEMEDDQARWEIARLAATAESGPLTLMCVCHDEDRCHRSLLGGLIATEISQDEA